MATHTLTTRVSRRTILGGGVVALGTGSAASAGPLTLPSPARGEGSSTASATDPNPDAELLRRMAVARRRRDEFNAARLAGLHRFRAMVDEPGYPRRSQVAVVTDAVRAKRDEFAERSGYNAAMARRNGAQSAYMAAMRDAYAIPARTLRGLYEKLYFAAQASHEADNGNYDYGDNIWLDIAVADLNRMAAA